MTFVYPWLFLTILPFLWIIFTKKNEISRPTLILRIGIFFLIGTSLAQPSCILGEEGFDIVLLVDRSQSMPSEIDDRATEIIQLLEKEMEEKDRLAIFSVTERVILEKDFTSKSLFQGFQAVQDPHGSRLDQGIEQALHIIPTFHSGRVILLTDGENTGTSLETVRQKARARNIPIYVKQLTQAKDTDVSISSINYPKRVAKGEPVQISADILSPMEQEVTIHLKRNGQIIASGKKKLALGHNPIQMIDALQDGGISQYELSIESPSDKITGNNTATFGTLMEGERKILILNQKGVPSSLHRLLERNNLSVDTLVASTVDLSTTLLTRYQVVILQDVPSIYFNNSELKNLAYYVEKLGGGLLMTGGPLSFGMGGYIESPLEELLPVNLEIRQEHRKVGLALGMALDRSGSMSIGVGPNLTKMDLANQGASTALGLLSPIDSTVVFAVDTQAHLVIPFQDVRNSQALSQKVLGIESMGGGIYVGEALDALHPILKDAKQKNRHIALFADANDSVDQDGVLDHVDEMREDSITVSVIALGQPSDAHADFLAKVALKGGGDIYFTMNPAELPKLFAMDTMLATKSSFKEEPVEVDTILGLTGIGGRKYSNFPKLDGYNITYFKKEAQNGLQTRNTEPTDPILAYQQYGLGMTAAFMGQIDGSYGKSLQQWSKYTPFFIELVQSISASQNPSLPYAGVQQEGLQQVYTIESKEALPKAKLFRPDGKEQSLNLEEVDTNIYQAKLEHNIPGIHVVHVETEKGTVLLPPLSMPYSSEFQPRSKEHDQKEIQRLTSLTGGALNQTVTAILKGDRESKHFRSLLPYLLILTIVLLLLEIADRRLQLFKGKLSFSLPSLSSSKDKAQKKQKIRKAQKLSTKPVKEAKEESTKPEPPPEKKKTDEMREALKKLKKK